MRRVPSAHAARAEVTSLESVSTMHLGTPKPISRTTPPTRKNNTTTRRGGVADRTQRRGAAVAFGSGGGGDEASDPPVAPRVTRSCRATRHTRRAIGTPRQPHATKRSTAPPPRRRGNRAARAADRRVALCDESAERRGPPFHDTPPPPAAMMAARRVEWGFEEVPSRAPSAPSQANGVVRGRRRGEWCLLWWVCVCVRVFLPRRGTGGGRRRCGSRTGGRRPCA